MFHNDDTDSRSKQASRTNSMQWYTGFRWLIACAQPGKPLIGKYVPETKSNGVMSADWKYENESITLTIPEIHCPRKVKPSAVKKQTNGTAIIDHFGVRQIGRAHV